MCGICASIGNDNQVTYVVEGLKKLEYRGYDSSGIAFFKDDKICAIKSVGEIKKLEGKIKILNGQNEIFSNICIGHTRWATHGKVSEENSHPHFSANGEFAMVHNGIIENFEALKKQHKIKTCSQTDTEVFVNLISKQKGNILQKIISACSKVVGSFAVAILHKKSNKIYLARRGSPLMFACENEHAMVASDMSVLADYFDKGYILGDDEFAVINSKNAKIFDKNGKKIEKSAVFLKNKGFFQQESCEECFMKKEIFQQPEILKRTFEEYKLQNFDDLKQFESFHFIACGTAYHSSLLGAFYLTNFAKKICDVAIASEFRYSKPILNEKCLYVFVSQSGETADTIACAKMIKQAGCKSLCVTNVPMSSLENLCDFSLPTLAGKEVAVASTKAFTSQVFTLLILALKLAGENLGQALENFVEKFYIQKLDEKLLHEIFKFRKIFFIGRGQDYSLSLEGALKLKEIAYINCIGIAAGELKHGTIALIDDETLVIAISTQEELKRKLESNILEVQARGGKVLLISQYKPNIAVDYFVKLESFEEYLMPIVAATILQQIALEYTLHLNLNPDKPRNLAKSVTVE